MDLVLYHAGPLPQLPEPINHYDAVLFALTLRELLPDDALWHTPMGDELAYQALYRQTRRDMEQQVRRLHEVAEQGQCPAFFLNFCEPVLNPNGRLMPADSFGNIRHFIHQLNLDLDRICRDLSNCHAVDFDAILSTYGKMYFTDEFVEWYSHGSMFPVPRDGSNGSRMESTPSIVEHFTLMSPQTIADAVVCELLAQLKILRQQDQIKLVVVDLDDTLWRGVIGDSALSEAELTEGSLRALVEGWPLGLAEALLYCKKRGVLLGIISRNDEDFIRKVFPAIFGSRLKYEDFASVLVNFSSKPENMATMLSRTNILPGNTIFIDDNPHERAQMQTAFPSMRVLGRYFLYSRQILLHAPEMQVARVSPESAHRTKMIQANESRLKWKDSVSAQDYLRELGVKAHMFKVTPGVGTSRELRAIELINKTNQWNSTGEKVSLDILAAAQARGETLLGFSVEDRFGHHGDVCFLRLHGCDVIQFVMSCRIAGLQIERLLLGHALASEGIAEARVRFLQTGKNAAFERFVRSIGIEKEEQFLVSTAVLCGEDAHISFQ
ncbi:HAD-IIIC family phosphatase [Roseateles sp. UC29_93]|uniref:HAD-IIIC family phosphatase n=1 Tax=Roseateles sp. UC29_93 TaxID=3350177 RepID=UPI003670DD31